MISFAQQFSPYKKYHFGTFRDAIDFAFQDIYQNTLERAQSYRLENKVCTYAKSYRPFYSIQNGVYRFGKQGKSLLKEVLGHASLKFPRIIRDIIAQEGDIKQGENGEKQDLPIPCQATAPKRAAEGVTTRVRAKAVMTPRAPCLDKELSSDEIVCSAWGHAGAWDKEPGTKTNRTTIQSRTGMLQDNLTQNNAILYRLKEKGNVKPFSGGNTILQELFYNDPNTNNANSYSGTEIINISPDSPITAAQFNIKQYASAVTISGLEVLQNSGKERIIDLLEGRMQVAEARLMNAISSDLYGDGTANNGKALDGLAAAISTTPSSGVYGGIDPSIWQFWRNKVASGTTVSATNIFAQLTALTIQQRRNADGPDLILMDNNYYQFYVNSLQAIQRVNDNDGSGMAGAGFQSLKFYGAGTACDVVLANGAFNQSPANRAWVLNTDYIHFRPHSKRNFVPIGGERESVNQDAVVKIIGFAGNLTTSNRFLQGVLTN